MRCEFSERTYEKFMDKFLSKRGDIFSPSLSYENVLGFDSSYFTEEYPIWVFFPPKVGVIPTPQLWNNPSKLLRNPDVLPPFRLNLFMQYKRPTYISRSNGKEYGAWHRPYFRYNLTRHQLRRLQRLEQYTTETAVVLYSAPAFWKNQELWNHYSNDTIALESNFVVPSELQNHYVYTYTTAGGYGQGFSESTRVRTVNLDEKISSALSDSRRFSSNYDFINNLYSSFEKVVEGLTRFSNVYRRILSQTLSEDMISDKILKISNISLLMNLTWSIIYEKN